MRGEGQCRSKRDGWCWPARSAWWWALALALAVSCAGFPAVAQDSAPLSPATALIWAPTTPLDVFVLQTLRPLLGEALESSRNTDARLSELEQQIVRERLTRQQEQIDWQKAFAELSSKADRLQGFFSGLSERLTTFSGDEQEQYRRATEALDGIQRSAAALETQVRWLRAGCWILGTLAAVGTIYAGGNLAGRW